MLKVSLMKGMALDGSDEPIVELITTLEPIITIHDFFA